MDTIILKIYGRDTFRVQDKTLWVPELIKSRTYQDLTPSEQQSVHPYLRHFVLRPKHQHFYRPKVEMFETLAKERKAVQYVLMITFSVPKLLFGDSLQEATHTDKIKTIQALKAGLEDVGVYVKSDVIESARVAAVHFCKNVPLPKAIRMQEVLDELMRVDISKVVDVTSTQHKQGGRVLNIYAGTIDRAFYDKVSDAMRPKNKRKDKWRISPEREVIERYGLRQKEVFRYEYRIKKMQTVMREVNTLLGRDAKTPIVFSDLFIPDLCKSMVVNSWRVLIQRPENQLALLGPSDKLGLLLHILTKAKEHSSAHSLNNALTSYGLAQAIREHGAKEVRRVIFGIWSTDHSERLTRKMRTAADFTSGLPYSNCIAFVDGELEKFTLITLALLESGI